jgi:hypothetical protein
MKAIRRDYQFAQWCSSNLPLGSSNYTEEVLIRQAINSSYIINDNLDLPFPDPTYISTRIWYPKIGGENT